MSARDQDAVKALLDVVDAAISVCDADAAQVQVVDRRADTFRIVAQRGLPQPCNGNAGFPSGADRQALRRGDPVILEDIGPPSVPDAPPAPRLRRGARVRAFHATPMRGRGGEFLGALSALFSSPHRLDAREMRLLDLLARQAAYVLERDEAEALRRLGLQAASAAAWRWNIGDDELVWSPEACVLHGRAASSLPLRLSDWVGAIHSDDQASAARSIREAVDNGVREFQAVYRVAAPGGGLRWLAALGRLEAQDGSSRMLAGVTLDITDQKRAKALGLASDAALRQSQERLRFAAEAGRLTFVDIDVVAGVAYRAENYAAVMGYAPVTPLGGGDLMQGVASLLAHVAPDDRPRVREAFRAALQESVSGRAEFRMIGDDKRERWIDGAWTVTMRDGRAERLFVTALDITELVAGRNALAGAKAEADRSVQAKSNFLATASHDLRQPVQSLILLLAVLERQITESSKALETARMMSNAVSGLQGLLTGILDISRLEAGVLSPEPALVELGGLLRRLGAEYAPLAAAKGLAIRVAPGNICARADPSMLERALRNLIENAVRYTAKGRIVLGVRRRGLFARLDVIDTGVGIPEDKRAEIFDEFRQLNNPAHDLGQGLGLGLAIVARLAKLMDAGVEVASCLGRGSRFSLTLPVAEASGATAAEPAAIEDAPAARVLVVEDDDSTRLGLVNALECWSYRAVGAASGEAALDRLAQGGGEIDLVICDYRLGAGRTGVEAVEAIEARLGRRVPVIMLSGDLTREHVARIGSLGVEVLHKPVMLEQLHRKIASMIARGEPRRS